VAATMDNVVQRHWMLGVSEILSKLDDDCEGLGSIAVILTSFPNSPYVRGRSSDEAAIDSFICVGALRVFVFCFRLEFGRSLMSRLIFTSCCTKISSLDRFSSQ
jgi:hypothetical protein